MSVLPQDWALPELTPFNAAWFTSGAMAIQRCTACRTLQHPPEEVCHACGAMAFDTVTLAPTGTVHSYTVVHDAANPALADSVPYTVVLVSLDDAPHIRVVGNIPGTDVHIGMPVNATWEARSAQDGATILLPQWLPASALPLWAGCVSGSGTLAAQTGAWDDSRPDGGTAPDVSCPRWGRTPGCRAARGRGPPAT